MTVEEKTERVKQVVMPLLKKHRCIRIVKSTLQQKFSETILKHCKWVAEKKMSKTKTNSDAFIITTFIGGIGIKNHDGIDALYSKYHKKMSRNEMLYGYEDE